MWKFPSVTGSSYPLPEASRIASIYPRVLNQEKLRIVTLERLTRRVDSTLVECHHALDSFHLGRQFCYRRESILRAIQHCQVELPFEYST